MFMSRNIRAHTHAQMYNSAVQSTYSRVDLDLAVYLSQFVVFSSD